MKKAFLIMLFLLSLMLLTGCGESKRYNASDYILELNYKPDFRVLQLTDIHMANKDDRNRQYKFLTGTINQANADLIVITGDSFTFADKKVAKELFSFFDSFGIPWTITFGNHDEQCYFSIDWLTGYLNELNDSPESYCIFKDIQDDDVTGNANFAINLMDGGVIKHQIIIMDSNRYNYGEYVGYDYIKQNQIDWYDRLVEYTKTQNGGVVVPSSLYFHIPLPEWYDAWDAYERGEAELIAGSKGEKFCSPDKNTGFFAKIEEKGSTKAINVGHDHINDFIMKYKGIYLVYGVDSTDRIYFDEEMLGGCVMIIKTDNSLSFEQIIRSYDDYE